MSDIPFETEENRERFLTEIQEGIVTTNSELLRMKFLGKKPDDPQDEKTRSALLGIKDQGAQFIEGGTSHSITIIYHTQTGEITADTGKKLGDSSILRTVLIKKGETREILLYRKGSIPSTSDYDEAISGIRTGPDTGTRRIMPERISPEHPTLRGINEIWGESQVVANPRGDLIMLKTIRKFNATHGPQK